MEERTIVLTIEYDGTRFCGWQRQPNARTVQGVLEEVLGRVLAQDVRLDGVSRTDAGVHALGQRASFTGAFGIPTDRIPGAVNHILAGRSTAPGENGDVRIVRAEEARPGFHARHDARGKRYRYLLYRGGGMPVFLRNYRYQVREGLDVGAMRRAAALLEGEHDFAAFQAAGSYPRSSTVRDVWDISVVDGLPGPRGRGPADEEVAGGRAGRPADEGPARPADEGPARRLADEGCARRPADEGPARRLADEGPARRPADEGPARPAPDVPIFPEDLLIEVSGNGFLYHMVRNIVGTLVEVGTGRRRPEEMAEILAGRDRGRAGHTAPAQGLWLDRVYYDEDGKERSDE